MLISESEYSKYKIEPVALPPGYSERLKKLGDELANRLEKYKTEADQRHREDRLIDFQGQVPQPV